MKEKKRRGRPCMDEAEKKKHIGVIRLTDEEADILRGLSNRMGIPKAQVMRNALIEYEHIIRR